MRRELILAQETRKPPLLDKRKQKTDYSLIAVEYEFFRKCGSAPTLKLQRKKISTLKQFFKKF